MGWCHEFGPQIRAGCGHPMTAADTECYCAACGVRCEGRFHGCTDVWSRGPTTLPLVSLEPTRRSPEPATVEPSGAAAPSGGQEQAPTVTATPTATPARPGRDEMLHSVSTALETVAAELRSMRAAIESGRSGDVGAGRVTQLLDGLPARIRAAVHDAVAGLQRPEATNGPTPSADVPQPPADPRP